MERTRHSSKHRQGLLGTMALMIIICCLSLTSCSSGSDSGKGDNSVSPNENGDEVLLQAPGNVRSLAQAANWISLTWTDTSTNEQGFKIEQKSGTEDFKEIVNVAPNSTSHTIMSLTPGTGYSFRVRSYAGADYSTYSNEANANTQQAVSDSSKIIFLHHSTGEVIWNGGVSAWFSQYNSQHQKNYAITQRNFPDGSNYPWNNYPYDYWNIWVKHAGGSPFQLQDTLEILTKTYNVIIWKHCFPVSEIEVDTGSPDIASSDKRIENYKLQYNALKAKMRQFPSVRFIVWTGAAQVAGAITPERATRARDFFQWVKDTWDEKGDNIFVWDFYELETEGGIYLKGDYAASATDSHPAAGFASVVAPCFSRRIVDVIEGRGDTGTLTGK